MFLSQTIIIICHFIITSVVAKNRKELLKQCYLKERENIHMYEVCTYSIYAMRQDENYNHEDGKYNEKVEERVKSEHKKTRHCYGNKRNFSKIITESASNLSEITVERGRGAAFFITPCIMWSSATCDLKYCAEVRSPIYSFT